MGADVNCCRRPQALGKKDIKIYKKNSQKKTSDSNEKDDDFEIYDSKKHKSNNYLTSIYADKNDFTEENAQINSNFSPELISHQAYATEIPYPTIQNQDYTYDNTQYVNSYTTIPQQNILSQPQYTEVPSTQYVQSGSDYQYKTNDYTQNLASYNIPSDPVHYENYTSNYASTPSYEYNNTNNYSSNEYYSNQPSENINILPTKYIDNNYSSYNNDNISVEYPASTFQNSEYSDSYNSSHNQYLDNNPNNFSNYEFIDSSSNQYIESPSTTEYSNYQQAQYFEPQKKYEYTIPENQYYETQNFNYENNQQEYSEPTQIQYVEYEPKIPKTVYVCKPKKYVNKIQYIEPQTQIQQVMYTPKEKLPDTQKEPEDDLSEDEPRPMRKKNTDDLKDSKNNSDEINEERRINNKDDESESENDGKIRNDEIEKKTNYSDDIKVVRSARIEKKKESTACQVPGFISNFLTKIFH